MGRKRSRYGNVRVTVDGVTYDSKKEYRRFCELRLMEGAGIIEDLRRQVRFLIVPKAGANPRERHYIADFTYTEGNGKRVIEDVKSPVTRKDPTYTLKKALVLWQYPDWIFRET